MKAPKVLVALVVVLTVIIIVLLGVLLFYNPAKAPTKIDTLMPIVSADGHLTVTAPGVDGLVSSPVTVTGSVAGGGWFFEATFPVKVVDADGAVLGRGVAQAQTDWMSTSSVPFTAIVQFAAPSATEPATGTIVLSKDNPSGAPQNAGSLSIPVRFR